MSEASLPILAVAVGVLGAALGGVLIRSSGANTGVGRRLAGARSLSLRALHDMAAAGRVPSGAVRVEGRVRCANPLVTPDGDRLAALHRDVEVLPPDGRWRVIERVREARPVDLWERATSVPLDLASAAEPLITIPHVWEGSPAELDANFRPAVERLAGELGPLERARATTRQVTLVDQVIVLAVPGRDAGGRLRLDPPRGGFVVATVELDVAMRLLAGARRTRMLAGFAIGLIGLVAIGLGLVGLVVAVSS